MLEMKDMTENESRAYLNYDANLVYKYKLRIITARVVIKKKGLQVFLEQPPETGESGLILELPIDERTEIYRFIERSVIACIWDR